MSRQTNLFAAAALFFFAVHCMAQNSLANNPGPPLSGVLGPQLIVWSETQKPQPVPQPPLPPPDLPGAQSAQQAERPASQNQQEETARAFVGTIVQDGEECVLKQNTDGATYRLDDQVTARDYVGKQVKIMGALKQDNVLHIVSIQVMT